ncbi:hypothetical protein [Flavobacterium sp.]|uniref:hypothetical protein n=1 Tax=Flavobacterium sp. TaxID=239 RepID=UPI0026341C6B|nr:hypothetical protein [Flavobacterium sp.]
MKNFAVLSLAILLASCAGQNMQQALDKNNTSQTCPETGNCTVEIMRNTALLIEDDIEGKFYYKTERNTDFTVIRYKYVKDTNPALADAGYTEEVVFEVANSTKTLSYTGNDMQKIKMLFGVMCFCKGKAGFYKVEGGSIDYKNDKLYMALPDIVEGQKLKDITISF